MPPAPLPSPTKATILQVENSVANATVVQELLARRADMTLVTAMNGRQGIATACALQPDTILLDMRLPDLNGLEVLVRLRENPVTAKIPVIVLSSNAFFDEYTRCMGAGAFLYLTKPYRLTALMAAIDAALNHAVSMQTQKLQA